jgi:hypothetical protein
MTERMDEVLDDEDWQVFARINDAVKDELDEFLESAKGETTPDMRDMFKLGVILGITRTLQWIKIRSQQKSP